MQILIPIPFPRINILGKCLITPVILYTLLPPAPRSRTFSAGANLLEIRPCRTLRMVRWVGCYPIKMVRVGFEVVLGCSQSEHRTSARNDSHNWYAKFKLSGLAPPVSGLGPPVSGMQLVRIRILVGRASGGSMVCQKYFNQCV